MLEYVVVCFVAVVASALTLFSGFGLNTMLMPVMAIFFPPAGAVAMTALVHCANNIFKTLLMRKHVNAGVVLRFGLPALACAVVGAWLLTRLSTGEPFAVWHLGSHACSISTVKIVIAVMMALFALEPVIELKKMNFGPRLLPLGGALSGFLGGLSGHQGALRSAFLLKCGLDKETFVGTGAVITLMVDLSRIIVYVWAVAVGSKANLIGNNTGMIVSASLAAFFGAFIGKRLLKKVTVQTVQWIVSAMMILIAALLISGII